MRRGRWQRTSVPSSLSISTQPSCNSTKRLTSARPRWKRFSIASTNASPVVYTVTANGFSNGDVCVIGGITGNLSANQLATQQIAGPHEDRQHLLE